MNERAAMWGVVGMLACACTISLVLVVGYIRHQNDGLRAIICFSETYIRHDHKLTQVKKTQDLNIYNHMLSVAHLKPCD